MGIMGEKQHGTFWLERICVYWNKRQSVTSGVSCLTGVIAVVIFVMVAGLAVAARLLYRRRETYRNQEVKGVKQDDSPDFPFNNQPDSQNVSSENPKEYFMWLDLTCLAPRLHKGGILLHPVTLNSEQIRDFVGRKRLHSNVEAKENNSHKCRVSVALLDNVNLLIQTGNSAGLIEAFFLVHTPQNVNVSLLSLL